MKYKDALRVAEWLADELSPGCERIEIAGSIRRRKPDVKDVEIVAIPSKKVPRPEFGEPVDNSILARQLRSLEEDLMLKRIKGGEKYLQFEIRRLVEFCIPEPLNPFCLDLFLVTPPSQWGVEYLIRTGPGDFSRWIVTQKSKGGALPDGYFVKHNVVWTFGTQVPNKAEDATEIMCELNSVVMPEERHYFELCGLPWTEPAKREARWNRYWKI